MQKSTFTDLPKEGSRGFAACQMGVSECYLGKKKITKIKKKLTEVVCILLSRASTVSAC